MAQTLWGIFLLAILLLLFIKVFPLRAVIIFEYQRGLKYRKGRYVETLSPGRYWILPVSTKIVAVDIRPQFVTIPGQEVITSDGVTLKISVAAEYEVSDPAVAINNNASYQGAFYLVLQMAVRELVGHEKVDAIIENRTSLSQRLAEVTREKVASLGLRLISADLKDVMLPGELRRTFAQVVKAQKEAVATLERARGETAALRNLANAAKMIEDNPNLLQLRALQTVSDSTGNTLMLGVAPTAPGSRRNGSPKPDDSQS